MLRLPRWPLRKVRPSLKKSWWRRRNPIRFPGPRHGLPAGHVRPRMHTSAEIIAAACSAANSMLNAIRAPVVATMIPWWRNSTSRPHTCGMRVARNSSATSLRAIDVAKRVVAMLVTCGIWRAEGASSTNEQGPGAKILPTFVRFKVHKHDGSLRRPVRRRLGNLKFLGLPHRCVPRWRQWKDVR